MIYGNNLMLTKMIITNIWAGTNQVHSPAYVEQGSNFWFWVGVTSMSAGALILLAMGSYWSGVLKGIHLGRSIIEEDRARARHRAAAEEMFGRTEENPVRKP